MDPDIQCSTSGLPTRASVSVSDSSPTNRTTPPPSISDSQRLPELESIAASEVVEALRDLNVTLVQRPDIEDAHAHEFIILGRRDGKMCERASGVVLECGGSNDPSKWTDYWTKVSKGLQDASAFDPPKAVWDYAKGRTRETWVWVCSFRNCDHGSLQKTLESSMPAGRPFVGEYKRRGRGFATEDDHQNATLPQVEPYVEHVSQLSRPEYTKDNPHPLVKPLLECIDHKFDLDRLQELAQRDRNQCDHPQSRFVGTGDDLDSLQEPAQSDHNQCDYTQSPFAGAGTTDVVQTRIPYHTTVQNPPSAPHYQGGTHGSQQAWSPSLLRTQMRHKGGDQSTPPITRMRW